MATTMATEHIIDLARHAGQLVEQAGLGLAFWEKYPQKWADRPPQIPSALPDLATSSCNNFATLVINNDTSLSAFI